jgi:small-conductance mechanosensitive channel
MIVSVASSIVLLMGLLIAFSQLGVEVAPMLAGLGMAGFVLGFALQDTLANFAAGIMLLAYRPSDVGDLIDWAGGVFGKVSAMNLVSTTILTVDNQTRVVPNGKIWGDVITNVTAQRERRVDLVVGISYDDDIPHAEEVIRGILEEHPKGFIGEPDRAAVGQARRLLGCPLGRHARDQAALRSRRHLDPVPAAGDALQGGKSAAGQHRGNGSRDEQPDQPVGPGSR